MTDVSVIIVNWNTRDILKECLESIYEQTQNVTLEIIIVDNASSDGSTEMIKENFPQVILIENAENLGFAAANNIGFSHATGKYILLLNSDTLLLNNAFMLSIEFMEHNPHVGVVGCTALLPDGSQQKTIYRDLSLSSLFINIFVPERLRRKSKLLGKSRYVGIDLESNQEVDVVAGCFMCLRKEIIELAGPLDDSFLFYGEEAEWCYRIRKKGWKVAYCPTPRILHYGGESTIKISSRKAELIARGQIMMLEKTKGKFVAYIGNILMLTRDILRLLPWLMLNIIPQNKRLMCLRENLTPSVARIPLHLQYLLHLTLPCTTLPKQTQQKT